MKIFLSHSNKDKQNANTFKKSLHKDIKIWIDNEKLVWGDKLELTFSYVIKTEVDFLIVFLSENALCSKWVEKELKWAFQRERELNRTFVLPILFFDVDQKTVPAILKGRKYLRLHGYDDGDFKRLADEANNELFSIITRSYSSLTSNLNHFFIKSYRVSNDVDFKDDAIYRIKKARNITMAGLCVNLLWENKIVDLLVDRAKLHGVNVRLCLANPEDKEVKDRIKEEFCDTSCQGATKNTILYIFSKIREWVENNGGSKDFLKLLNGVPKFAVIILDEDIFFYPYGYKASGVGSPMFLFRNNGCKEASFFIDFAEKLIKDSTYAGDVIKSWTV